MTMIGIATYGDYAEILTDSASYSPTLTSMGRSSKVRPLPHMDTAIVSGGDLNFGNLATYLLESLDAPNFDVLIEHAPQVLVAGWENEQRGPLDYGNVFLVGYSDAAETFRAFVCSSFYGFEAQEFDYFLTPSPWTQRPSMLELEQYRETLARLSQVNGFDVAARWLSKPAGVAPADAADWLDLAKTCREQRALTDGALKVVVAGKVRLARLTRNAYRTRVIHEYNDSGAEFRKLIAGSMHPQAQLGPCWCNSGKRYIDCHLAPHLDDSCWCESGHKVRDCCAVATPGLAEAQEYDDAASFEHAMAGRQR